MKPYIFSYIIALLVVLNSWALPVNAQSKTGAAVTLAQSSVNNPRLSEALQRAGLMPLLSNTGPYTFFAPSDAALIELAKKPAEDTREILLAHVVEGRYTLADLHDGRTLTTLGKQTIKVLRKKDKILLNGVRITMPDQVASNGIMHTVDRLLARELEQMSLL